MRLSHKKKLQSKHQKIKKHDIELMASLQSPVKNNSLFIEGNYSGTWKGVKGCCSQERIDKQADKLVKKWVKKRLKKHPGYKLYSHGWKSSKATCRSGKRPLQGRWCNGSFNTLKCTAWLVKK